MTPDSSAIVAAFGPWHALHGRAVEALREVRDLVAHAELEAYSVLTRLPAPFRVDPNLAAEYLSKRFGGSRLALPPRERTRFVERISGLRITGGRVYDALIAATAANRDLTLVTCDRRATSVYENVGVGYELL